MASFNLKVVEHALEYMYVKTVVRWHVNVKLVYVQYWRQVRISLVEN